MTRSPQILRGGLSLRTKFVCLVLFLVVTTSTCFGWYFYVQSRRLMTEQISERVRTIAWTLALNSRQALAANDGGALEDLAAGMIANDDVVHVAIFDTNSLKLVEYWAPEYAPRGHDAAPASGMLFEVESLVPGAAEYPPDSEPMGGGSVPGLHAPGGRGSVGLVRVGISSSGMERALRRSMRSSLIVFFASLSLGILGTLVSLRYVITPIRDLSSHLARVAAGDYASELPATRRDEIGQLARSFNEMTAGLRASRAMAREAQEALLQSNRLAAVGEVAGQAAHEILNPLSAVQGRLEIQQQRVASHTTALLEVLREIAEGWRAAYRDGGWDGLHQSLARPVPAQGERGTIPLIEEDLDNLSRIQASLSEDTLRQARDLDFQLLEVRRIGRIVEGMRSLSRAGAHPENLTMGDVVESALEELKYGIEKSGIAVEIVEEDKPVQVRGDRAELTQILSNLIRNSMHAIESHHSRGGGRISIHIRQVDGTAELAVTDNGAGIEPTVQAKLFEAPLTTKDVKEGTGLGLRICRRLARGNRGDVRLATSAPGQGTTIVMELPGWTSP